MRQLIENSSSKATLRIDEVAELLCVSRRTVERWIAQGIIRSILVVHTRRVPLEELERVGNCRELTGIDTKS